MNAADTDPDEIERKKAAVRAYMAGWRERNRSKCRAYNKTYRELDREKTLAREKAYREETRDQYRARVKAWRAADPERYRANKKAWRDSNPEKVSEMHQAYRASNPEAARTHRLNRIARKLGSGGVHTAADRLAILKLQKYRCAYCPESLKKDRGTWPKSGRKRPRFHMDHIIPLALGGSNARTNLQALCPGCNARKSAKDPIDFARELGKLL